MFRMLILFLFTRHVNCCAPFQQSSSTSSFGNSEFKDTFKMEEPLTSDYDLSLPASKISSDSGSPTLQLTPPEASLQTMDIPPSNAFETRRDAKPLPVEKPTNSMFPNIFDLFRRLEFRPFHTPTASPLFVGNSLFAGVPRISSPFVANPVFHIKCSPPTSWTFCEPNCGSGDQAVDEEDAKDNAQHDIRKAITMSFGRLHLTEPNKDDIEVKYSPNSTVLEDTGPFYGTTDARYRVDGQNVVAYKIYNNSTGKAEVFSVDVSVRTRYPMTVSAQSVKLIAREVQQQLIDNIGVRFTESIKIDSIDF